MDFAVGRHHPNSFRLTPVTALPRRSFYLPIRLRYLQRAGLSEIVFAHASGCLIGVSLMRGTQVVASFVAPWTRTTPIAIRFQQVNRGGRRFQIRHCQSGRFLEF